MAAIDWKILIDRPPLSEGWHLVATIAVGVVVVALLHREVKRRVARAKRAALPDE